MVAVVVAVAVAVGVVVVVAVAVAVGVVVGVGDVVAVVVAVAVVVVMTGIDALYLRALILEMRMKLEIIADKNCSHGCGMYGAELLDNLDELQIKLAPLLGPAD